MKAPNVALIQPLDRRDLIAGGLAEGEELRGHNRADCVAAKILVAGVTAAVAEEAGHRAGGANLKDPAQHVARRTTPG